MSNLFDLLESMTAERQRYILENLIHHLYLAYKWPRLFDLLDSLQYGQAKLQDDPSARSYVRDLDLGRQAAASEEWTFEKKLEALPHLWQYTLLRCNLANQADLYPLAAFRFLALLGRDQEALGLAEFLTNTGHRIEVLIEIAEQMRAQKSQEGKRIQILLRARDLAYGIEEGQERAAALSQLGQLLVQDQQWGRAEAVIRSIEEPNTTVPVRAKRW